MTIPNHAAGPQVTFFVESREESEVARAHNKETTSRGKFLLDRLGDGDTVSALRSVRGRVAVALSRRELAADSALIDFLREYNILDIDIDVWATLSDKEGYWLHAGNIDRAHGEIIEIINALDRAGIPFSNVGLDLEFPIEIMKDGLNWKEYRKMKPWQFSPSIAALYLRNLIEEILRGGQHGVHAYEIPILGDREVLRKLLGIPPPVTSVGDGNPKYKRVGLTYTSAKPPLIGGSPEKFVQEYSGGRGRVPALGIVSASETNPGRNLGEKPARLLTDLELARDVKAAMGVSPQEFFVFALNGLPVIERVRTAIAANLTA